jgi:hypothetical protein
MLHNNKERKGLLNKVLPLVILFILFQWTSESIYMQVWSRLNDILLPLGKQLMEMPHLSIKENPCLVLQFEFLGPIKKSLLLHGKNAK